MAVAVFSGVTAYVSRDVMLVLHKKGEQFTSGLLLRITKYANVKSMSNDSVEIQGQWDAIRHVHDLLLKACEDNTTPTLQQHHQHPQPQQQQQHPQHPQQHAHHPPQLAQCSMLEDVHSKKDHIQGYQHVQQQQPMAPVQLQPRLEDPHFSVHNPTNHPPPGREFSASHLFPDMGNAGPLFPMENTQDHIHKPPQEKSCTSSQLFDDIHPSIPEAEDKIHKCSQCEYTSMKRVFLRDHVKRMHGEAKFPCNLCDAKYRIKKNLNRHVKSAHSVDTGLMFKCDLCNYTSSAQKAVDDHKLRNHRTRSHSCNTCHKSFGMKKDLLRHTKIHDKETLSVCHICQKSYSTKWYLKQHMKSHDVDFIKPKFVCSDCGKDFASQQILNNHISAVHQGRKVCFSCKICGKNFSKKRSLLGHELEHEDEKPHKCDICNKNFRYHTSLARHKLRHEIETPFKCNTCVKAFESEEELNSHKESHLNDEKFECNVCQKSFTQKQALIRHGRVHTGEKPFECDRCGKRFSDSSILRRHKLSKHKENAESEVAKPPETTGDIPSNMMRQENLPDGYQQQKDQSDLKLAGLSTVTLPSMTHKIPQGLHVPQMVTTIHDVTLHHSHNSPLLSDLGLRLAQVHTVGSEGCGLPPPPQPHENIMNSQAPMSTLQSNTNLMPGNLQPYHGYPPQCMMSSSLATTSPSLSMSHNLKK